MRQLLGLLAVSFALGAFPVSAAEPVVIRFSHVVAQDAPKGRAADRFAQLVAERSEGRARVEVHPDSRLYGDQDEMSAVQAALVEIIAPSLSKIKALRTNDFEVFDLPFLFPDVAAVHRVTQGTIGKEMLDGLSDQGVIGLAFWDNGFKQFSADRPLRLPQDAKRLKFRIQPSRVLEMQMTALEARPVIVPFSEVFTALKTGAVNGTENPPSNLYTQKMHLAQSHLTLTDHGWLGYAVLVNRTFWEGLAPELRGIVDGAMRDATAYANETAVKNNAAALEAVKSSSRMQVITLTPEEKHAWRLALAPVHDEAKSRISPALLERIYKATGYAPPQ